MVINVLNVIHVGKGLWRRDSWRDTRRFILRTNLSHAILMIALTQLIGKTSWRSIRADLTNPRRRLKMRRLQWRKDHQRLYSTYHRQCLLHHQLQHLIFLKFKPRWKFTNIYIESDLYKISILHSYYIVYNVHCWLCKSVRNIMCRCR